MKLDRDRPYGEIIGTGGPKGAKFYQGPKYFDQNGDELSAKKEPAKKEPAKKEPAKKEPAKKEPAEKEPAENSTTNS